MENEVRFLNLLSPIIIDILSRLPTKTIILCRSVCKAWLNLISDSEFIDLHLSRSPTRLLINNISASTTESSCFKFNLAEIEHQSDYHFLDCIPSMNMELPKTQSGKFMIGSINGIVCLYEFAYQYDVVHIWSPTMRECITVTTPDGVRAYPNVLTYGFGLSSVTGQYNVAWIFQEFDDSETGRRAPISSVCCVYTLDTGSWRGIGHAPFLFNCRERGVFSNGNLHWLIEGPDGSEFISCLSFENEVFQPFPPPLELSKQNLATLNLYDGCQSVCDHTSDFDIMIWVMKKYGVKKSWTKEAVISKYPMDLVGNYFEVVHVIKVFKDGEILLLWRDDWLFLYHPERKTVENVDTLQLIETRKMVTRSDVLYHCIEARDHGSSFLSLKSFGTEIVNMV